jgi:hypothetical protein
LWTRIKRGHLEITRSSGAPRGGTDATASVAGFEFAAADASAIKIESDWERECLAVNVADDAARSDAGLKLRVGGARIQAGAAQGDHGNQRCLATRVRRERDAAQVAATVLKLAAFFLRRKVGFVCELCVRCLGVFGSNNRKPGLVTSRRVRRERNEHLRRLATWNERAQWEG